MFEEIYKYPSTVRRHLGEPLVEERTRYLRHCAEQGYTKRSLRAVAGSLLIVQDLLGLTGSTGPVALSEIHAAAERWSCRQPAPFHRTDGRKSRLALISSAVNWLRFLGQMESSADPPAGYAHLLQEFADYLRVERGSTEQSIRRRSIYVRDFLSRFCPNGCLSDITVADLDEAVARKGRDDGYTRRSVQSYADALRSFIRYGGDRGYCSQRLADAITSIRAYRHENLPTGPAWEDVQRLLAAAESDNPKDVRDRAILLLLTVYGLRAGEVRGLKLDDFDWENNLLFVSRPKSRKKQIYPLCQTAGDAILSYLRKARPRTRYREVFLTTKAPIRPLRRTALWTMVSSRLSSLEIGSRHRGPHSLRHACATHLLAKGLSLKEIGDHLGHRLPETTAIYAKVDLSGLREVASFPLKGLL